MSENLLNVLLVEHRDEVFARLATDLAAVGLRVQRADSAVKARRRYAQRPIDLILVNAHLPNESGWLFSSKLRLTDMELPIWIYTHRSSEEDVAMANFVQADELIDYEGDLWRLSDEVSDRLGIPDRWPAGSRLAYAPYSAVATAPLSIA